jgi:hypothetical protein
MGWASRYIQRLLAGEAVSFRPHGQSMTGRIESGQLCTVVPIDRAVLEVGDIVLILARPAQKTWPSTGLATILVPALLCASTPKKSVRSILSQPMIEPLLNTQSFLLPAPKPPPM